MLTEFELSQITDAVSNARLIEDFHIEAKKHYDTHARLDRLLNIFEKCENEAWKFIIAIVVFAGIVVSAVWAAFHK